MMDVVDGPQIRLHIEDSLKAVVGAMRLSRVRLATGQAAELAIGFSAFLFPLNGLLILLSRAGVLPHGIALTFAIVSLLSLSVMVVRATLLTWLKSPSYSEAAERIDLAADNHNRIGTALDLSQGDRAVSPFATAAIAYALMHLKADALTPLMPAGDLKWRRSLSTLVIGTIFIAATLSVPLRFPLHMALLAGADNNAGHPDVTLPIQTEKKSPLPSLRRDYLAGQKGAKSNDSPSAALAIPAKQTQSNSGAVTSADNSTGASAVAGSAGNKAAIKSNSSERAVSPSHPVGNSSSGSPASMQNVSGDLGTSSDASAASQGNGDVESQMASDPSAPGSGTSASTPNTGSGSTAGQSGSGGAGQQGGSGGGQGGDGKSAGKGGGESMESVGGAANRNGPPSGKTPSKKSRGTMSQILTQRQPDFIKGRELPGSDERTESEIPPQHTLGTPADPLTTNNPGGTESAVDRYWVPPDARGIAADYFARFHSQARN